MNMINTVSGLLKNREETISRLLHREITGSEIGSMLMVSISMFSVFGFLIGASQGMQQALSSAVKLPLLFYFTSFICFPTLFFFLSFLGARQDFRQLFSFIILCNTYIAMVLAAFAPVTFFFLIAGYSYALFKFINIIIFSIAGLTGIYLFYNEMKKIINDIDQEKPSHHKLRKGLLFLRGWSLLFGFIGLQLSFTLSPFFGLRGTPFMLLTDENANFFSNLMETIAQIFIK
jgi:hypothetical protein